MEEVLVTGEPFFLGILIVKGTHSNEFKRSLRLQSLILGDVLLKNLKRVPISISENILIYKSLLQFLQWEGFLIVGVVSYFKLSKADL